MNDMAAKPKGRLPQFTLRSLLASMVWFALILAICVEYQHAATRHREALELRRAGFFPNPGRVKTAPQPSGARPANVWDFRPLSK